MKYLLLLILSISSFACSKKDDNSTPSATSGQVTFYMGATTSHWNLMVDGVDKGALKGTTQMPVCSDPAFITLTLSIGSHSIDTKSMDGYAWGNPVSYTVTEGCHQYKVR